MVTQERLDEHAAAWEALRPRIQELMADADTLGVPIPEEIGQAMSAILLLPPQIRAMRHHGNPEET